MAAPTTNLDRTLSVTLANPTPPTNSVVTYQGTPPTPQGLAPTQAAEPDITNAWLCADPLNGAAAPDLSGLAEADGTEISTAEASGRVTGHSVLGNYREFHFHPSEVDPIFGPELVTLGDFSAGTGWTLSGGATITGGRLVMDGSGNGQASRTASATLTAGTYKYEFDIITTVWPIIVGIGGTPVSVPGSNIAGHFIGMITSAASAQTVTISSLSNTCVLDNFSVKKIL
jgi:hypothetical protein